MNRIFLYAAIIIVAAGGVSFFVLGDEEPTQEILETIEEVENVVVETDQFELILPVRENDIKFQTLGIWPFGVQGGDHPFGHPGIDFESVKGTEIIAAADGKISHIGDSGFYEQKTFNIHVKTHDIIYTAPMDVVVSEGQQVNKGDVVAIMNAWIDQEEIGYLHFGVRTVSGREDVCPAEFFSEEASLEIKDLHEKSLYQERDEFPLICNPCPEGGCR